MVYGVCRVMLRDRDEAEDAAQQTFLSAHRSLLTGTNPRDPAAWLATIARNECRARIRERMAAPLALVSDEEIAVGDAAQEAGRRAEVGALCAALADLPPQQREAILLREFYGLSYDEVASALGVSLSAVESLIFRSRRTLQHRLRPARTASGALVVPAALGDSLARAVPGFSSGSGGVMTAALAKAAAAPLGAKLAAATLLAGAVVSSAAFRVDAPTSSPLPREPHASLFPISGERTDALAVAASAHAAVAPAAARPKHPSAAHAKAAHASVSDARASGPASDDGPAETEPADDGGAGGGGDDRGEPGQSSDDGGSSSGEGDVQSGGESGTGDTETADAGSESGSDATGDEADDETVNASDG